MDNIPGNYRRINNITGWLMFVVASAVYLLTVEPTISFWDCGEFILSAFRLQVGHPPGAPLFLMMGRIATLLAGGDGTKASLMMNSLSAICSGFAIMFLYWTITRLVSKIYSKGGELQQDHTFAIIGSGVIGALVYTFSDTFWFSAVEGELYALSSLIIAVVFWAMLKWEEEADDPRSGRWIILMAYIMGLGLGIHRLNLLIIPVFVLVYYFKKYELTTAGIIKALIIAVLLLYAMVFVIIPGVPEVAGWFELLFVNVFGLPYNSGVLFYVVLVFAGLAFGIKYSLDRGKVILNYGLTILLMIMIGYSSYAMIMIRSSARPPMNQNNPSDIFSLSYYINMKQYGSSPKIYGNYYNAPVVDSKQSIAGYNKINGKYKPYYHPAYKYDKDFETIFPRMYDSEPDHVEAYKYWGKIKGRPSSGGSGKEQVVIPTFGENLRYFFRYQVGFMYLRYFMWNFAGRQNDVQGDGNPINGNWISGLKFIDEARLGPLDKVPADLKTNPARNTYFLLPLLIGLAGMYWHYRKSRNDFWLVMGFFIMTGVAIILYLNQYPNQPRERDYAYAGSFYAFAIWAGIGFMFFYDLLIKYMGSKASAAVTFAVLFTAAPLLMGSQNWDDHDRSGRYTARDIGANYLNSCAANAILFTYGDNDSFPVWCVQDVEGVRTDVRVANLSYIQAGWYISMMRQKAFESDPMPLSLPQEKYVEGEREQIPVLKRVEKPVPLKELVNFAAQDDRKYQLDLTGRGDWVNYLPTNKFLIDVDTAKVLSNGTVKPYFRSRVVSPMTWEYTEDNAFKGDLAIMDLLSTNKWERPVYYSTTVPSSQYKGLEKFFAQEGLAYRVVPINTGKNEEGEYGIVDTNVMFENMMNKFKWGNAEDPSVYLDENNRRMFSNFRRLFGVLAKSLVEKGDTTRALEAVKRGLEIVPPEKMPYDYFTIGEAEVLLRAGKTEEGNKLLGDIMDYSRTYLDYAITMDPSERFGMDYPIGINMQTMLDVYNMSLRLKLTELTKNMEPELNRYYGRLYSK
ncbi:MAG TPA: DUF2723 domain-containing protein [Bacteroidales bacterium]|nr:DUF2723 domain-containing protein [Bacteroidales bacterium]